MGSSNMRRMLAYLLTEGGSATVQHAVERGAIGDYDYTARRYRPPSESEMSAGLADLKWLHAKGMLTVERDRASRR